jgi:hypothetical protein
MSRSHPRGGQASGSPKAKSESRESALSAAVELILWYLVGPSTPYLAETGSLAAVTARGTNPHAWHACLLCRLRQHRPQAGRSPSSSRVCSRAADRRNYCGETCRRDEATFWGAIRG